MEQNPPHWLTNSLISVAKIQMAFAVIYVAQIMAYDAAKLITPDILLQRWYAIAGMIIVSAAVWYLARSKIAYPSAYMALAWTLIISSIAFAAFNVYTQRGMASLSVTLFFVPIIISAILLSRAALFTTATLCAAVYTTTAVAYFVNYFNEGYKIELYGEILFYSGLFFIAAALLWTVLKAKRIVKT